jgi:hypothetical protein
MILVPLDFGSEILWPHLELCQTLPPCSLRLNRQHSLPTSRFGPRVPPLKQGATLTCPARSPPHEVSVAGRRVAPQNGPVLTCP